MPTLPATMIPVLRAFAPLFSARVWDHAQVLLAGAILAPAQRTVTAADPYDSATEIDGLPFWSRSAHGNRTEFGGMLRRKVDNRHRTEDGLVTITSCGTARSGAAQYALVHAEGKTR